EADGRYDGSVAVAWRLNFQYEDGPRDCESVAVDAAGEQVLLLSKRTQPPVLYTLPLRPGVARPERGPAGIVVATRLGPVASIPQPSAADIINDPVHGGYRAQPTGMDIAAAGDELVLMTYGDVYRYLRTDEEPWLALLQAAPEGLEKPPASGQTEALAYSRDARTIYFTAEDRRAPIYRFARE
ncbi:MAG: hypothetical protein AAGD86_12665, partial [Pseudomonadota bacterium]